MKALVGAFNQEKALVGAFSVIVELHCLMVYSTNLNWGAFLTLARSSSYTFSLSKPSLWSMQTRNLGRRLGLILYHSK